MTTKQMSREDFLDKVERLGLINPRTSTRRLKEAEILMQDLLDHNNARTLRAEKAERERDDALRKLAIAEEALGCLDKWFANVDHDEEHPWRISIRTALAKIREEQSTPGGDAEFSSTQAMADNRPDKVRATAGSNPAPGDQYATAEQLAELADLLLIYTKTRELDSFKLGLIDMADRLRGGK